MSNTDGEDTQKVSLGELLLNAGTRIVDLEKQSNDQVEIITHLEKELASLREQLAKQKFDNENAWKGVKQVCAEKYKLELKLKQKEQENRELVACIEAIKKAYLIDKMPLNEYEWNRISRLSAKLGK